MSFSSNPREALDASLALEHRVSRARSCAMHVGQKWKIHRSLIIEAVQERCGIDLDSVASSEELERAIHILEEIRCDGLEPDRPI